MPTPAPQNSRQKFLGLFAKKERWGLTWRGGLLAGAGLLALICFLLLEIHPFLAVTDRVDANYLVMEGWVHQFAANQTAAEFNAGKYRRVFVTGVPVEGSGYYAADSATEAYVGAGLLKRAGISENSLQRIPRRKVDRDRTYGSALALKAWLAENNLKIHALNIVTEATHARRTRMLFQQALGPDVQVGIIAASNPDYNASRWWRYSEGVREVVGESVAWLYAAVFFHPEDAPESVKPAP